jgi:hypothetical protein
MEVARAYPLRRSRQSATHHPCQDKGVACSRQGDISRPGKGHRGIANQDTGGPLPERELGRRDESRLIDWAQPGSEPLRVHLASTRLKDSVNRPVGLDLSCRALANDLQGTDAERSTAQRQNERPSDRDAGADAGEIARAGANTEKVDVAPGPAHLAQNDLQERENALRVTPAQLLVAPNQRLAGLDGHDRDRRSRRVEGEQAQCGQEIARTSTTSGT